MTRPKKKRTIDFSFNCTYFKPVGVRMKKLEKNIISYEEMEALRLQDFLEKNQTEASLHMNISQSTFYRLINKARKKIVDALINGKAIKIEGGDFIMKDNKLNENSLVAVSSSSKDLEGNVDTRFGRCKYFLLVSIADGKIKSFDFFENTKVDMQGGVGTAVVQMLADKKVDAVISGNIGPRALEVLKQFNIFAYQSSKSKKQALQDYIDGIIF